MKIFLLLLAFSVCLVIDTNGQKQLLSTTSECNVKAKIFPANDTIVTDPNTRIVFSNQSINSTSHKFIIDRYSEFTSDSIEYYYSVGLHRVQLVAYNGPCTDTTTIFVFNPGIQPENRDGFKAFYGIPEINQYANSVITLNDGNYILGGYTENNYYNNYKDHSLLIKVKPTGCIDWSRKIDNHWYNQQINKMINTGDGGFVVLIGYKGGPSTYLKIDAAGNLQWSKQIIYNNNPVDIRAVAETSDGGFVFSIRTTGDLIVFLRVDKDGNIVWSKNISKDYVYYSDLACILEKDQSLYIGGLVATKNGDNYAYESIIFKIDFNTGDLVWAKKYADVVNIESMSILQGDLFISGAIEKDADQRRLTGIFSIDPSGAIIKSYNSFTGSQASGRAKLIPRSDGGFYIFKYGSIPLPLQPYETWESIFVKVRPDFTVDWSRTYGGASQSYYTDAVAGKNDELITLGDRLGFSIDYFEFSSKYMFQKFNPQDPSLCNMWYDSVYLKPVTVDVIPYPVNGQANVQLQVNDYPISLEEAHTENRYMCPSEFLDSCSVIRMDGPKSLCNLNDTFTYRVFRNNKCVQPVEWKIPDGVTIISQSNSELKIKFQSYNQYKIFVRLPYSCIPVIDSITILAEPKGGLNLNLGRDTSICVGNSYQLKAGYGFLSYSWNDGSSDSTLTANQPGKYWVNVLDSCNNILSDTILISTMRPIPLSIGPDRIKCNNDTLHLNAPEGFLNYTWSPDYSVSSVTAQSIVINPSQDTSYFLKAEKTPGCFGYDTVKVFAKNSPAIYLGADTSFCNGDSIKLNAGVGFTKYEWNNTTATQDYIVKVAGTYRLAATNVDGCKSYDTLNVLNVYKNPTPALNHDSTLCLGKSRSLYAGNFASYIWNTGNNTSSITVNNTGIYTVEITDNNNCKGTDTVYIKRILPLPSGFLPADTVSICNYSSLTLRPTRNYKEYIWSTNESTAEIKISAAGIYWLQVTDYNNCTSKDSIAVLPRDCMLGFYIPSAFTPNNDGKNDNFKPLLFGNIQEYYFTVYNRWGQVVFKTKEPGKGWDGSFNGIAQESNVFIWTCTYQLNGEKSNTQKGTVALIK